MKAAAKKSAPRNIEDRIKDRLDPFILDTLRTSRHAQRVRTDASADGNPEQVRLAGVQAGFLHVPVVDHADHLSLLIAQRLALERIVETLDHVFAFFAAQAFQTAVEAPRGRTTC